MRAAESQYARNWLPLAEFRAAVRGDLGEGAMSQDNEGSGTQRRPVPVRNKEMSSAQVSATIADAWAK
jgi:hypothetical protein